jgi:hypothetical protein
MGAFVGHLDGPFRAWRIGVRAHFVAKRAKWGALQRRARHAHPHHPPRSPCAHGRVEAGGRGPAADSIRSLRRHAQILPCRRQRPPTASDYVRCDPASWHCSDACGSTLRASSPCSCINRGRFGARWTEILGKGCGFQVRMGASPKFTGCEIRNKYLFALIDPFGGQPACKMDLHAYNRV